MSGIVIAGHRGAMASEPENTLRSFARAIALGAHEIELDVHETADGALVVIHDETLDRTTDGHGAVKDHTLAQLRVLDAGGGERVPQLVEVLDAFPAIAVQVEVKTLEAASGVAALFMTRADADRCTVTSFHPEALRAADQRGRSWRLGLISGPGLEERLPEALDIGADRLLVHWDLVGHPVARAFSERGALAVWPCNDAASVERAVREGHAGLTTDDPGLAVRTVQAAGSGTPRNP